MRDINLSGFRFRILDNGHSNCYYIPGHIHIENETQFILQLIDFCKKIDITVTYERAIIDGAFTTITFTKKISNGQRRIHVRINTMVVSSRVGFESLFKNTIEKLYDRFVLADKTTKKLFGYEFVKNEIDEYECVHIGTTIYDECDFRQRLISFCEHCKIYFTIDRFSYNNCYRLNFASDKISKHGNVCRLVNDIDCMSSAALKMLFVSIIEDLVNKFNLIDEMNEMEEKEMDNYITAAKGGFVFKNATECAFLIEQDFNGNKSVVDLRSFIKKVIFNDPATIIIWKDDTKTIVKCGENDKYDPEKGLAMAIAKKCLGDKGNYYETFKKFLPVEDKEDSGDEK